MHAGPQSVIPCSEAEMPARLRRGEMQMRHDVPLISSCPISFSIAGKDTTIPAGMQVMYIVRTAIWCYINIIPVLGNAAGGPLRQ